MNADFFLFHHEGMEMVSVRDLDAALEEADCMVIATDYSVYDWKEISARATGEIRTAFGQYDTLPPKY